MAIVQHENDFGNTPNENIFNLPFVLGNSGSVLYYLATGISEELECFICTGKRPDKDRGTNKEYHVFPQIQEQEMVARWTQLGMEATYHRQQIELVSRITITYINVRNPMTGLGVSLIPWFMVAGRPYPIFAYVFAIGHYQRAEKKSLEESAAAARELFGISSFHKSTVSRSLKAMEEFIGISRLGRPLAAEALNDPACLSDSRAGAGRDYVDVIGQVSEILAACPSFEALENELGEKISRLPEPANRGGGISQALGGIPDGHFEIIMHSGAAGGPSRDGRKRPPRRRNKAAGPVQRALRFVGCQQREEERKAIIAVCLHLALDAATTCHRFLI